MYSTYTTERLKFLLWANLQDNLHRGDILGRTQSEEYKLSIMENIRETEKVVSAIRAELKLRESAA